jgi:ABC-type multidrug transport system ATPase subunit
MTPVVKTVGLTKRYGHHVAVDGLNLTVHAGEVLGFLGPNGAGKSTTLRMLLGLVRPTAGRATVLGVPPCTAGALARVGAMVETPAFYPYLSGRDNLRVLAGYAGVGAATIEATVERGLHEVGLTTRAGDKVNGYSAGMRQRLGVAAALLKDPQLLILDEPTSGLDPHGTVEMRALIRRVAEQGRTVLLASHILAEVEQVCDRAAVIHRGRLIAEGTVAELRGQAGLLVRAEPVEQARTLVQRASVGDVTVDDGALRVAVDPARAPEVNRVLVGAGLAVYEIRPVERSLEDVFLHITGEAMEETQQGEAQQGEAQQ